MFVYWYKKYSYWPILNAVRIIAFFESYEGNLQQENGTPQASLDPTDADEQLKYIFLSQSCGPSIPQHSSWKRKNMEC